MTRPSLHIVGVGPGDPELLTLKAARLIAQAEVVAYFCRHDRVGHARSIAAGHIGPGARELRFAYPFTTERSVGDVSYAPDMAAFYDACAQTLADATSAGARVVLLCEGDPFLFGSAMYLFDRLAEAIAVEVVPGIPSMAGCWSQAGVPMAHGDDVLCVLPATMPGDQLADWLARADAAVIMKIGRNLPSVRDALVRSGRLDAAVYVERGTQPEARVLPLAQAGDTAPYFSLVLVPGRRGLR
ncbi:precorrin-2 C20-methyltransferase [Ameyamaea chiangmaiensis NBRC 103196]|uniref:Precorrin-2 C(20)-methyltransferase n=1 Tax=Ameyamaea chiangmaiensis TaxID=442969 RepID=A0A850PDJ3_9PROT|nr:precorrin-2 C(20)-methyltransferase [Ameyamaea chiangmaiensis]MBS4076254.1 precorrin-2 C(20)-methyltransferase [Ameyamaea chiangmaiensis]NVN42078.1 precorrin-2 C(20)-methyltransferase [Ameyamaea chiangmaiensis]GBQ64721.1 precorrin-2 C20-methyltransferase [Ameyamaea chiangmaiensis NBRC 103196]